MKLKNILKVGLRSLVRNKMRTFLTMLGIIIGVASVIAMLAIGEGSKRNIESSISSLGTNSIIVIPGTLTQGGVRLEAGTSQSLREQDAKDIIQRCPSVKYVSPVVQKGAQAIAGSMNWRTVVYGAYRDYFRIRNLNVVDGDIFSESDERAASKVCVLGRTVADNLFGDRAVPVGEVIRINRIPFTVVGILEEKGQSAFGTDQDDIIIAPFSTVQKRMLASTNVNVIAASAVSEELIEDGKDEIIQLLRGNHNLMPEEEDDFMVRTQTDLSNIFSSVSTVLTVLLASIAGISLLVGGIGIMNIMLVSVAERTREIGIRLAVGARSRDVLVQFMIEAVFISFTGGLLGIVFGVLISAAVSGVGGWPVKITLFSVLLGFLFSVAIGVFFGWYPARKAARLHPIQALRYE